MSPPVLPVVLANADFLIAESFPMVQARGLSAGDLLDFCTQVRRRAIATLLLRGQPDEMLRQLSFSGRAFLHALPALPPASRAIGEQTPLLDALASGDLACASGIGSLSPGLWNPAEELEEDFLYMAALADLLSGDREAAKTRMRRYAEIVGDDEEPRLGVLQALQAGEAVRFAGALEAQMLAVQTRYRERAENAAVADEELGTEGRVSVEGVALVRLADHLGLVVSHRARLLPPLIARARWRPGSPDEWSRALVG